MNGIKMSDCRFYVNEKERTIVCVIPNTRYLLRSFVLDNFRFSDFDFDLALVISRGQELVDMPNSFIGKAVCAEDDEWNEETGRLIAFSRAKDKCYRSFFKRAQHFVQAVDSRLSDMIDIFNKLGDQVSKNKTQLEERIVAATDKK